jgi:hypothetical protein
VTGAAQPEWTPAASQQARGLARALVVAAVSARPDLFVFDGVDLAPAAEQALFGRLRRGSAARRDGRPLVSRLRSIARVLRHGAAALLPHLRPPSGSVVVVLLQPAQAQILASASEELARRGHPPFLVFESHNRAAARRHPGSARLVDQLTPGRSARLLGYEWRLAIGLAAATRGFSSVTDAATARRAQRTLAESLGRIALYGACLDSVAARRPAVMATFNEIGRWARLLPAAARRHGVPSLDIAHAEAADDVAIQGIDYDRMAAFGPAAARVLARAGVPADRVVQVGAPRFDSLIHRHRGIARPPAQRRVVFASQWLAGRMTAEVKRRTVEAAVAAAEALAPCELVIRPHPIERDDLVAQVLASLRPRGVTVRVERGEDLYDTLDGAWLLVTGWSNTAFEAVLSNVPVLCINATGGPAPTGFAEEGLALDAHDPASAAGAAAALLQDGAWTAALARARAALSDHLGVLDGRATQRLADLVSELAGDHGPQFADAGTRDPG